MDAAPLAVELTGIWKRFPGVVANAGTELRVKRGSIHAVLGENGAGKSTLMNVLAGVYRPEEGEVRLFGERKVFANPADALAAGVGMVHQEFRLVGTFTVAENVVLGAAERVLHMGAVERRVAEIAEQFSLDVDPQRHIWQLSMGERQRVEILKALWRDAEILILDEPTAVLTPNEADELGSVIRRMADDGRSVIFISHKLHEVKQYCDEATVLRGGKTVSASVAVADLTPQQLAERMVGEATEAALRPAPREAGGQLLAVHNLCALNNRNLEALNNISLSVHAGEIVGIAGVAGNGQRELSDVIAGLRERTSGTVTLFGRDITGATPRHRFRCGLSYIPEDRVGVGLAPQLSVTDNAILRSYRQHTRGPLIAADRARAFCAHVVESFKVRAGSLDQRIAGLSGGNLQRLLVGRELTAKPSVIVASQPTRGLDVQGVKAIQELLIDARNEGLGVLMVSEDLDELLAISDRIIVMHEGRIAAEFKGADANRAAIGLAMAGESA
ncbi:MAG: ABC transporter ATP-binding protein [Acidimicrobiaceae bacterium]|nr:ABC transporter ATP-binding protein [Acidimicrobiia bacterium]MCY4494972.1 ABC transporter ATP-binding protein [Acidimicrobiaceae bacterium]